MSQPSSMKAILIKEGKGPASNLYLGEAPLPTLQQDQVLIKTKAFGINRADCMQRLGAYPPPPGASEILGLELSGTVASSTSSSFKEGDEVFGLTTGGAYAEFAIVPAGMVLRKPKELSFEEAAGIPENFLTAWQALTFVTKLQKGEDILIHAGASGVGLAAIQLAKQIGAKNVFVTAGSDAKIEYCKKMGATAGINYKAEDWAEGISKLTSSKGVGVIIDFIGANYFNSNVQTLARDGRMVILGLMGGSEVKNVNLGLVLMKRLHIEGSTLRSRTLQYQGNLIQDFAKWGGVEKLVKGHQDIGKEEKAYGDDKLICNVHEVFSWKNIKEAHEEMEANKNTGKIVIRVD